MWETQQQLRWLISSVPLTHTAKAKRFITMYTERILQKKTKQQPSASSWIWTILKQPQFKTKTFFFSCSFSTCTWYLHYKATWVLNECIHLRKRNYSCESLTWHFEMLAVPLRDLKTCSRSRSALPCVNTSRELRKTFYFAVFTPFCQRWPGTGSIRSELVAKEKLPAKLPTLLGQHHNQSCAMMLCDIQYNGITEHKTVFLPLLCVCFIWCFCYCQVILLLNHADARTTSFRFIETTCSADFLTALIVFSTPHLRFESLSWEWFHLATVFCMSQLPTSLLLDINATKANFTALCFLGLLFC